MANPTEIPGRPDSNAPQRSHRHLMIAIGALTGIAVHLGLRYLLATPATVFNSPLLLVLGIGGALLVFELASRLFRLQFGSDLLAGISIVTSVAVGEYLAGALVVLMLSGGEALEQYAVARASSALQALARRMPTRVHLKRAGRVEDVPVERVAAGDEVVVFPHETCPVDGEVIEGDGCVDESYLTGESVPAAKAPRSAVFSGTTNGEVELTIRASRPAAESRYARIMQVMRESEQSRPHLRRLGDQLGAAYTPVALVVALGAWAFSGDADRFLAVLVVATPCPLLIAIPVAIIGAISSSARRSIIIRNPAALEHAQSCRTVILDKTGTLTSGEPHLDEQLCRPHLDRREVLKLAASIERYSQHPLARAIMRAAKEEGIQTEEPSGVRETAGAGLTGQVAGRRVLVTSRGKMRQQDISAAEWLPPPAGGSECIVSVDEQCAALYRFHDEPRRDSAKFVTDLDDHGVRRTLILSGDREPEVRHLASQVGIGDILSEQTPEQKLEVVRQETRDEKTLYVGDGVNDAPAMAAATVAVAMGKHAEAASEAADVVVMDDSLSRVHEFLHISQRMRHIALQSAVGGIALSLVGMGFAAAGYLPPVMGALAQELIDVLAVANALRAALPPTLGPSAPGGTGLASPVC